jgi:hypothetical protein
MSLWQHQLEGVERIMRDDYVHALLWQPGAGKSRTVIEALDCLYVELGRPIRVLIVCPKSVLGVWPQEFEKHCLVPFEVQTLDGPIADRLEILAASGPRGAFAERPPLTVCLLSYSTFSAKPHAKAAVEAVSDYEPDVIVLDECVPWDTEMITAEGPRLISDMRPGDLVMGVDHRTGEAVWSEVQNVRRTKLRPTNVVAGARLTDNHPVWVSDSEEVLRGKSPKRPEDLRVLRGAFPGVLQADAALLSQVRRSESARGASCPVSATGGAGEDPSSSIFGLEPLSESRSSEEIGRSAAGEEWVRQPDGRKRGGSYRSAGSFTFGARRTVDSGVCSTDREPASSGQADMLQTGSSLARDASGSGGSRKLPQDEEGPRGRCSEESLLGIEWLDGPGVLERRDPERSLWNIETSSGNYFADGLLVHNCHAIKGAQSNTSKLLGKIGQLCPRRLILTGTPTPHSPGDVYGQWRFLDPSAFAGPDGKMVSWSRWLNGYAIMGGFQGRQIVGWRDIDDMEERMARKSSVVYTRDCHDLPELRVQKHVFELSAAEQRAYDEMRRDLLTVVEDDTITATNKLVSVLRLRQVTSGFLPNEDGVVRQVGTTRQELALGLIENLLASEKRVVVFAWSKHEVDSVYVALATARPWDTAVYRIAGDVSSAAREAALKCFADAKFDERAVMVAQCDSLNSGTNALVGASHVLYLSLTNNAGVWQQSLARLHRPGQTADKVVAHVLQAANSIDQHMLDSLEGRVDMQEALMEHVKGRQ